MIDNIISRRSDHRTQPVVNYRPDESAMYARRIVRISEEGRSRETLEKLHETTTPLDIARAEAKYRTFDLDNVYVKITEIEAEGSTSGDGSWPIPPEATFAHRYNAAVVPVNNFLGTLQALPILDTVRSWRLTYGGRALGVVRQSAEKVSPLSAKLGGVRYVAAAGFAAVVLAFTGYISVDTLVTNNEVKQAVSEQAVAGESTRSSLVMSEGQDEAEVKPSAIDSYAVAPDLPRVLSIEKIGVRARVLPMSVNSDGSMQAPVNIFDSGWYGASAKPGTPGAAIIDAHASGATREGLFAYLDTLTAGDIVSLERGDGQTLRYAVVHTETVPLDDIDMSEFLKPYGTATEGLNLITCTGKWLPEKKTYDHRALVYTKRV